MFSRVLLAGGLVDEHNKPSLPGLRGTRAVVCAFASGRNTLGMCLFPCTQCIVMQAGITKLISYFLYHPDFLSSW